MPDYIVGGETVGSARPILNEGQARWDEINQMKANGETLSPLEWARWKLGGINLGSGSGNAEPRPLMQGERALAEVQAARDFNKVNLLGTEAGREQVAENFRNRLTSYNTYTPEQKSELLSKLKGYGSAGKLSSVEELDVYLNDPATSDNGEVALMLNEPMVYFEMAQPGYVNPYDRNPPETIAETREMDPAGQVGGINPEERFYE